MTRLTKLLTMLLLLLFTVGLHARLALADGAAPASPLDQHWASYLVWAAVLGLAGLALQMLRTRLDKIELALQGVASTSAMAALEARLERALIEHQKAQEDRLRQYFRLAGRIRRIEDRCLLVHGVQPVAGMGGRGGIEEGFEDDTSRGDEGV